MRQKYMFVAALLVFLAAASIGLTEVYTRCLGSPDSGSPGAGHTGSENTIDHPQAEQSFQIVKIGRAHV